MEKKKPETKTEECKDSQCPAHHGFPARGRIFEGTVIKKFHRRIVIEFERTVYITKYERYAKKKTKLHARLPECVKDVQIGDYVQIQECRPLSKIIHFVFINKMREGNAVRAEEKPGAKK